jgi:hypothetical protein
LNDVSHSLLSGLDVSLTPVPAIVTALAWEISSRAVATQAALPVMLRTTGASRIAFAAPMALQVCQVTVQLELAIKRIPACSDPVIASRVAGAVGVEPAVAAVIVSLPTRLVSLAAALAAALPIDHRVAVLASREALVTRTILKFLRGGCAGAVAGADTAPSAASDTDDSAIGDAAAELALRGMQAAAVSDLIQSWPELVEEDGAEVGAEVVALRGLFSAALSSECGSDFLKHARWQADALGIRAHLENIAPSLTGLLPPE